MILRASNVFCAAAFFSFSPTALGETACRNFTGGYAASKHWLATAEKGEPLAQANVGDMYRRGDGVDMDFSKARIWIQKSVDQGCEQGEYWLAKLYFDGQGVDRDWTKYAYWVRKAAEKGLPEAQYAVGWLLEDGSGMAGIQKNEDEAFLWYQKAAEQGYSYAQWAMGRIFIEGRGVEKNLTDGYYWWSIAKMPDEEYAKSERERVRHQMTDAQIQIAESRVQDWRDKMDFLETKLLAEISSLPEFQTQLAAKYLKGEGTPRSEELAFMWLSKAAELGYPPAQWGAALLLNEGKGVKKDSRKAFEWLKKAAEQGNANAQFSLGSMYANGDGIPKNDQLAVMWYQSAANRGNVLAQNNLGVAYQHGYGVAKDAQSAYSWYLLAAASGNEKAANNRDQIERSLTPDERARAQAAARDWKPSSVSTTPSLPDMSMASKAKPKATGSGFFVSRSHVVTNFHVIDGCARIAINGKSAARVQSSDARNDLALLDAEGGNDVSATVRDGKLRAGESIAVIGYPLSGLLAQGAHVTTGNVSALAGPRNDVRLVQITAPVQSGNSGGPLIDASGNVAGVVVSKLDTLKSLSGILCARHIMKPERSMYAKQDEQEEGGGGAATYPQRGH